MSNESTPVPLGLKKSFGFGDRLGLATPGHLRSAEKFSFAGIFAQQSIREMDRTQRTPLEVMTAARKALAHANHTKPWGADADHLKTPEDVRKTAAVGFTFFTIDPSAHVVNAADGMNEGELSAQVDQMQREGVFAQSDWTDRYLGRKFDIGTDEPLVFSRPLLFRAAVKYGRAVAHAVGMSGAIHQASPQGEIEVSVDETDSPTSPLEHFFFAEELKHRGVKVVSLAPRFIGQFEKGIDYKGDLDEFDRQLKIHAAIAKHSGPYKISIHSGSDKFSVYPAIGRICGDLLHVKTAGTSYLEALRVVCRCNPGLFNEIIKYSLERFSTDRASYHISTTDAEIHPLRDLAAAEREKALLDERPGRQLLHVTFGSVLTIGKTENGRLFKEAILDVLRRHDDLHQEFLEKHFDKHISLLERG